MYREMDSIKTNIKKVRQLDATLSFNNWNKTTLKQNGGTCFGNVGDWHNI